mmetsp:Transcript_22560/g.31492  ORF Transcript_22560/g.31492 Transcript_22560/m.31492 type:complete len:83 (+) Transcript_22560:1017-1265(+)
MEPSDKLEVVDMGAVLAVRLELDSKSFANNVCGGGVDVGKIILEDAAPRELERPAAAEDGESETLANSSRDMVAWLDRTNRK